MSAQGTERTWFVRSGRSSQPQGPLSLTELLTLVRDRTGDSTLITDLWYWREGMEHWERISSLRVPDQTSTNDAITQPVGVPRSNKLDSDPSSLPVSHELKSRLDRDRNQYPLGGSRYRWLGALVLLLGICIVWFWNRATPDGILRHWDLESGDQDWARGFFLHPPTGLDLDYRLISRPSGASQLLVVGSWGSPLRTQVELQVVPATALVDVDFRRVFEIQAPESAALIDLGHLDPGVYRVSASGASARREFRVLSGHSETSYSAALRSFHTSLKQSGALDLQLLSGLEQSLQALWASTQRAEVLAARDHRAESRRGRWLSFHDHWSGEMQRLLDVWNTQHHERLNQGYYAEYFRALFGATQRVARYHEMQSVWLSGATLSLSTEALVRQEEQRVRARIQAIHLAIHEAQESLTNADFPARPSL